LDVRSSEALNMRFADKIQLFEIPMLIGLGIGAPSFYFESKKLRKGKNKHIYLIKL